MFESLDLDRVRKPFKDVFHMAPPEAIDLISKLIVFRPSGRLTAKKAL
jgi:hypothetical protein